MNFRFSKELIEDDSSNRPSKQLRLYKIFDDNNQIVGQLFYYPKIQIISFGDEEIIIKVISKFLKKTKYLLVDKKENKQIGEYKVFGGFGVNGFWQDVPSFPTGTISLDNTLFNFRRIPPEVRYSFFRQETWGYYKFRLYAIKGQEFFEYALKMDVPVWSKPSYTKYRPFVGTIESNAGSVLAMLAGLYLMEIEFDYEDSKNDG